VPDSNNYIIRDESLPGVNKANSDFSYAFSNRVTKATVISDSYKESYLTFVELDGRLNNGELIQVVSNPIIYRVLRSISTTDRGRLYKISRADGYPFTQIDLDNLVEGVRVRIKNREINNGLFSK